MAISFVIGRAGSGKTHRCFHAIVDALRSDPLGPPIYWLLPRQATFSAERELTCNSGLGGFCRARVLSFEEVRPRGARGLRRRGRCRRSPPLGRQMILGHLLREHQSKLKFFKSVAGQPGLAARLDATFSDFERAARTPPTSTPCSINSPAARRRSRRPARQGPRPAPDLRRVQRLPRPGPPRPAPPLVQVLSCISGSKLFKNATVFVDGFSEFTEYERRILAAPRQGLPARRDHPADRPDAARCWPTRTCSPTN